MIDPVTVSITRIVNPAHAVPVMAWRRAGQDFGGVALNVARP